MCFRKLKKFIAGCIIGTGIGILLILYMPIETWLTIIAIGLIICGIKKFFEK